MGFQETTTKANALFSKKVKAGAQGFLLKLHMKTAAEEKDEDTDDIDVVRISLSSENDNDKVTDKLTGIHAGENSAYAAVARWLMTVKNLYGRPLDNARDADFSMLFKDAGYDE